MRAPAGVQAREVSPSQSGGTSSFGNAGQEGIVGALEPGGPIRERAWPLRSGPSRLHLEGIELDFIAPGRPMENGFIESLNGKLRMSVSACTGSRALVKTNG